MKTDLPKYFERNSGMLQLFSKLLLIGIILISLVLFGTFICTLNRGFEITDEAYYMLLAIHPSDVKVFVSAQHWILSILWSLTGTQTAFRSIGLGILLFSAMVLTLGTINTFSFFSIKRLTKMEKVLIFACSISGALLYGASINFSPCYNLLAASGGYLSVGLIFFIINKESKWRNCILCFLAGCAIGIIFIIKASAALSVFSLTAIVIIAYQKTVFQKILGIALIIIGLASFVFIIAFPYLADPNFMEQIKLGFTIFKQVQGESSTDRILRYTYEFFNQQFWSGMFLIIPVTFLASHNKFRYKNHSVLAAILCVILLACIYLPLVFHSKKFVFSTSCLSSIMAIFFIFTKSVWTKNSKVLVITAVLFILPYAVSFGTGNGINTQIVASLAPWAIIISILAVTVNMNVSQRFFSYLLSATFVFIILGQVAYSSWRPYHLGAPIWEQNIPVQIEQIGFVKVDEKTADFVLTLDSIAKNCQISNNRLYLGLYGMPGVALVLKGIPYFSPWLTNKEQAEIILDRTDPLILREMVLGIRLYHAGKLRKLPKQLSDFPKGFIKCGEATYPFNKQVVQIWQADKLLRK